MGLFQTSARTKQKDVPHKKWLKNQDERIGKV